MYLQGRILLNVCSSFAPSHGNLYVGCGKKNSLIVWVVVVVERVESIKWETLSYFNNNESSLQSMPLVHSIIVITRQQQWFVYLYKSICVTKSPPVRGRPTDRPTTAPAKGRTNIRQNPIHQSPHQTSLSSLSPPRPYVHIYQLFAHHSPLFAFTVKGINIENSAADLCK